MSVIYRAKEPGFYGGVYYAPGTKRQLIEVDKPFDKDKTPSWMEAYVPPETQEVSPQIDFLTNHMTSKKSVDAGNHIEVL
jgi:hypothetical protein